MTNSFSRMDYFFWKVFFSTLVYAKSNIYNIMMYSLDMYIYFFINLLRAIRGINLVLE